MLYFIKAGTDVENFVLIKFHSFVPQVSSLKCLLFVWVCALANDPDLEH
jgi:hypothetical protein